LKLQSYYNGAPIQLKSKRPDGWRNPALQNGFRSTNAPDDARLVQIVGRHFHLHAVAHGEADKLFSHLAGDGRQHLMLVVEFNSKHRPGQDSQDFSFDFDVLFHGKR